MTPAAQRPMSAAPTQREVSLDLDLSDGDLPGMGPSTGQGMRSIW
jgi:hypothetical protein